MGGQTSVSIFMLKFLPRRCARRDIPTGASTGVGLLLMALKVAFIAPLQANTHTLFINCPSSPMNYCSPLPNISRLIHTAA